MAFACRSLVTDCAKVCITALVTASVPSRIPDMNSIVAFEILDCLALCTRKTASLQITDYYLNLVALLSDSYFWAILAKVHSTIHASNNIHSLAVLVSRDV